MRTEFNGKSCTLTDSQGTETYVCLVRDKLHAVNVNGVKYRVESDKWLIDKDGFTPVLGRLERPVKRALYGLVTPEVEKDWKARDVNLVKGKIGTVTINGKEYIVNSGKQLVDKDGFSLVLDRAQRLALKDLGI